MEYGKKPACFGLIAQYDEKSKNCIVCPYDDFCIKEILKVKRAQAGIDSGAVAPREHQEAQDKPASVESAQPDKASEHFSEEKAEMASLPKKNGHVRIPHQMIDKIVNSGLTPNSIRILLVIVDRLVGYQQEEKKMTLTYLSKASGIARPHISNSIKELVKNGWISTKRGSVIKLLNIEEWKRN